MRILPVMLLILCWNTLIYSQDTTDSLKAPDGSSLNITDQEITADSVIEKYINAIGGREVLSSVKDRTTIMTGTVQGFDVKMTIYQKEPNLLRQEIQASGLDQLIIFDGEKGIMKLGDNTMNIIDEELEKLKIEATFNMVLHPDSAGITITMVNSEDSETAGVYKIRSSKGSISWLTSFDSRTGLKVMEEKEVKTPSGVFKQEIRFSNYKEVGDIRYPFTIKQLLGDQEMNFSVTSIKVNQDLDDKLFTID